MGKAEERIIPSRQGSGRSCVGEGSSRGQGHCTPWLCYFCAGDVAVLINCWRTETRMSVEDSRIKGRSFFSSFLSLSPPVSISLSFFPSGCLSVFVWSPYRGMKLESGWTSPIFSVTRKNSNLLLFAGWLPVLQPPCLPRQQHPGGSALLSRGHAHRAGHWLSDHSSQENSPPTGASTDCGAPGWNILTLTLWRWGICRNGVCQEQKLVASAFKNASSDSNSHPWPFAS